MNLRRRGRCYRRFITRSKIFGKRTNTGRRRSKNSAGDQILVRAGSTHRDFSLLRMALKSRFRPIMPRAKRRCGIFVTTPGSGLLPPRSRNSIHCPQQLAPDLRLFALASFHSLAPTAILPATCESQPFPSPKSLRRLGGIFAFAGDPSDLFQRFVG